MISQLIRRIYIVGRLEVSELTMDELIIGELFVWE
jgi:hypothetical protein